MTNDRKDVIAKVIDELRTYIPEADKYMGRYILKGWADRLEAAPTTEQPGDADDAARYRGWRENAMSDAMAFADAFVLPDHREPTTSDWDAAIDAAIDAARAAHGKGGQG
jgi:hypothetical protein